MKKNSTGGTTEAVNMRAFTRVHQRINNTSWNRPSLSFLSCYLHPPFPCHFSLTLNSESVYNMYAIQWATRRNHWSWMLWWPILVEFSARVVSSIYLPFPSRILSSLLSFLLHSTFHCIIFPPKECIVFITLNIFGYFGCCGCFGCFGCFWIFVDLCGSLFYSTPDFVWDFSH